MEDVINKMAQKAKRNEEDNLDIDKSKKIV
jgi:hypothetical protein